MQSRHEAARLQKIESDHLKVLWSNWTRARIRIWTMAEFIEAPMEHLQTILGEIGPASPHRLSEVPRLVDLAGFGHFLRSLRNDGMHPYLAGTFPLDRAAPSNRRAEMHRPYLVHQAMSERFHSFVVFAEMRTGSNFLESNLNALEGVTCHGEAFNPHFIGSPDKADLLGMSQAQRDRNPALLLDMIEQQPGIGGFRYFHDHDPRILDRVLADPRCAKIILTRDPVESYVSWKIACSTGQWKLTDIKSRRVAKAHFDAIEFADYMDCLAAFRQNLMRRLHVSGQTAFCLTYEDLQSIEMPNGVACYLGLRDRLDRLDRNLKVQNPEPLSDKVSNLSEMGAALSGPQ